LVKSKKCLNTSNSHSTLPIIPPPKYLSVTAKGDSAPSNHYWALRDTIALDKVTNATTPIAVTLPDKTQIVSIQRGQLPIKGLSDDAKETRIFKDLNHSLISLGQLCDDNCKVIFNKNEISCIQK
jgi:hypothetical protein